MKRVLAFDFGASSGRAMIGTYEGGKLELKEIHRFSNDPVNLNGTLYWDILRLFFEIKQGITKAVNDGGFDAIGIDTWGVDFGLLDERGNLIDNPVHYRDERTDGMMEEVFSIVPKDEIYRITGNQIMRINTLYQLYYVSKYRPELLARAKHMLFIPDLFAYFLTGSIMAEYTIASTSQMLDAEKSDWAYDMLEKLGIPTRILPEIKDSGTIYGLLRADIAEELGCKQVPVVAVCTHDTGSAVVSVPSVEDDFCYVSSGTWSLFGTEIEKPLVNERSAAFNITNEGSYARKIRLLKNIMGLWLIQESRRQWRREGTEVSFADIEREALKVRPFQSFIDPDYPAFELPGNLPKHVQEYCRNTNQPIPQGIGEIAMVIYQSLAMKYRYVLDMLKELNGTEYGILHLVGGGGKDGLLSQMASNACNIKVIAGPTEATALGNVGVQMMALGEISDLKALRGIILSSADSKTYLPEHDQSWEDAYTRFLNVTGLKN